MDSSSPSPSLEIPAAKTRKVKRILFKYDPATETHDEGELIALWSACDRSGMFGDMVKVRLLTAQRREKVAREGQCRNAAFAAHLQDIIAAQAKIAGNPYVFPGRARTEGRQG